MTWSDRLAVLPLLRTRQALAEATRTLQKRKREIDALRQQALALEQRLDREKRKRERLERRLLGAIAADARPPLVVFDHIPKTAGSTFRRSYLTNALPAEERWILSGGDANARDRERFLALTAAKRADIRIVAGHQAEALRPHLTGARFVTIVRDPVERTISSYLHARFYEDGGKLWPDVRARGLSLAEFACRYVPRNPQSRVVLGQDFGLLDVAEMKERIRSRYALVGYTEAFDEFVFLLHLTEGLPLALYSNHLVSQQRNDYRPSESDLKLVRQRNVVDIRLHRVVREEFQARVAALPDETRAAMRKFLDLLKASGEGGILG